MTGEQYTNIDQASPALTGLPSTVAPIATAQQPPVTWQQMLAAIAGLSGGSHSNNIAGLVQGLGSNVNRGIPLYTPPLQALPIADEQQKQTTEGDVSSYAKIITALFGPSTSGVAAGAGSAFSGGGTGSTMIP